MEICGPQGDDHQSTREQSGIVGWTTVETEGKSKRTKVLLGKLSRSDRQPEPFISASSVVHSAVLSCTRSPRKLIRTRGSLPRSGTERPFNRDNGAEEGIVESETARASLEVTVGQQGGMAIFNFAEKKDCSRQTSEQETAVHSADGQEAVIPSEVIHGCETSMEKDEIFIGLHSKNDVAEFQKGETNQRLEEAATVLKDPSGVCTQMQTDVPELHFPLQNQNPPVNKDVIERDVECKQKPLGLVCALPEDKINLENKLEDQQKECTSLDNTTLSSHEIFKDTYQRLDNLEETIRELEMAISEIGFPAPVGFTFPQLRSVGAEKEAGKVDTSVSGCSRATSESTAFDCQMLMPQEASNGPPKSSPTSSKPSLLPKPQCLLTGNPQVQLFLIILLLSSTSRFLLQIFSAICPVEISSALNRQKDKVRSHLKTGFFKTAASWRA